MTRKTIRYCRICGNTAIAAVQFIDKSNPQLGHKVVSDIHSLPNHGNGWSFLCPSCLKDVKQGVLFLTD
jgi:hypothetical protein